MGELKSKSSSTKSIVLLTVIYFCAHFLLLVISGQWWDDWGIWTESNEYLINFFLQHGSPSYIISFFGVIWIPNWGYRVVVFLLFLFVGVFFYLILLKTHLFSEKEAFYAAAIEMTAPVNDARTTIICFDYTLSVFLFMFAFWALLKSQDLHGGKRSLFRLLSFFLFFFSYSTESFLVFTGVVWLYIFYFEINKNKNIILGIKESLLKYWSFILNPFFYFVVKNVFFKPYGIYEDYNNVSFEKLIKGILESPIISFESGKLIFRSYLEQLGLVSFCCCIILATVYSVYQRNCSNDEYGGNSNLIPALAVGVIVYYAGLFAYIVIRNRAIKNTGVYGRDSMLEGFGIAILVIALSRLLKKSKAIRWYLPILCIILGIFHFNIWYLKYQEDWYYQMEFESAVREYSGFGDDNTILCDFLTPSPIYGTRFYTLNAIYSDITSKRDKFFFSDISDLKYGVDFNSNFLVGYNCDDYDISDRSIDGILVINNTPLSYIDIIKLRFHEAFSPNRFWNEIELMSDTRYTRVPIDVSDELYELYEQGSLTSDMVRNIASY